MPMDLSCWLIFTSSITEIHSVQSVCKVSCSIRASELGSFHYDFVWECASNIQIVMHSVIFVCLWVNVTLTAY